MGMKVGIDPYGGNDPWSPNIVWSPVQESFDRFSLFSVEAVAQNSIVSVWTRSQPYFAIQHNDVYVDAASLVAVGTPARASRSTTKPTVCTSTSTTVLLIPTGLMSTTRIIKSTKVVPCVTAPTTPITPTRSITSTKPTTGTVTSTKPTTGTVTSKPVTGTLPIPASDTYTVVRGDTLSAIGKRFGIPWLKLAELNNLEPPYKIEVGQVLKLK